jgi:hypothetical protein
MQLGGNRLKVEAHPAREHRHEWKVAAFPCLVIQV